MKIVIAIDSFKGSLSSVEALTNGITGGLGFAFRSYLNATLQPGIDIVLEETGMRQLLLDVGYATESCNC